MPHIGRRMKLLQANLSILTILVAMSSAGQARATYIDFGDRTNPVNKITEGLISVQFTTSSGVPRSTGNLFGIDGQEPNDAAELIDGGNGVAEQLHFVFNRFVYIQAITISEFGAQDAGTFAIDGRRLSLRQGITIYLTPLRAVGGKVNTISWTGENLPGNGRGFSIDGMDVRLPGNGDFDQDLDVDGDDFLIWQRGVGVGSSHALGDADYDGTVNQRDLKNVWMPQFGTIYPAAAQMIPEPSALGCATFVGALFSLPKARRYAPPSRRFRRPQG